MRIVLDTETNGLLDRPDLKMLCAVTHDVDSGETVRYHGWGHPDYERDKARLRRDLERCTLMIGHNIAGFDMFVLEREFGQDWTWGFDLYDTRAISRLRYITDIESMTWRFRRSAGPSDADQEEKYPLALTRQGALHKLASWGYRLGLKKGSFLDDMGVQEAWSEPLEDYCEQDIHVNAKLFWRLLAPDRNGRPAPPMQTCTVESLYNYLLTQQELNGITFNQEKAAALYAKLCGRRDALAVELRGIIPPWFRPAINKGDLWPVAAGPAPVGAFAPIKVPKVTYKVPYPNVLAGRAKDSPFTPVEQVEFNPGSRQMIVDRLMKLYGWKPDPEKVTPTGEPQVDESVLADLEFPPIPALIEYLVTEKTLGQLSEGEKSWMKAVKPDGRIHHTVLSTGARTTRCSHARPNLAQVPKVKKFPKGHLRAGEIMPMYEGHFGGECRDLFEPNRRHWCLVGCDASGLELRTLAHRLAFYDDGYFAKLLLEGDPHTEWQRASGLYFRDNQKTLTYAFLYGAGDKKLGMIVLDDWHMAFASGSTDQKPPVRSAAKRLGAAVRVKLLGNVPGLDKLIEACQSAYERGYVKLIDGTTVTCKSEHGTLNDVLQGDGARVMKRAKVILAKKLSSAGMRHGWHYGWLLDVHDEWQIETPENLGPTVGQMAADSITEAGTALGLRLPLAGEWKVGKTWMETH